MIWGFRVVIRCKGVMEGGEGGGGNMRGRDLGGGVRKMIFVQFI